MRGRPSAPLGRTVRPSHRATHQKRKCLWTIFSTDKRTVRTPGADRMPFILKTHQRPNTSLVNLLSDLRTVRTPWSDRPQSNLSAQARETTSLDEKESNWRTVHPTWPDRPPVTSFSHKLININSNTFSFANVPTPPREQHHVHVC